MDISDNPFFTLEISARDNRKQIQEAADKKMFVNDSEAFTEACRALLIPDKRLKAEIRWFPGMKDESVKEITDFFRRLKAGQPAGQVNTSNLLSIRLLNFAVYMFEFRKFRDISDMIKSILAICKCFDTLKSDVICVVINNDRLIAGFPQISVKELECELKDYRNDILKTIQSKLLNLPQEKYLALIEELAENFADKYNDSIFLYDLLSVYELNILQRLEEHMRMIRDAFSGIMSDVPEKVFAELSECLKEWRKLANPLILAAKSMGTEESNIHKQAEEIFSAIREKAIALHNEHGRTDKSLRLTLIMKEYLAWVSARLSETIDNDIKELRVLENRQRKAKEDFERQQRKEEAKYNDWAKSIYYETEFGLMFKDKLIISAEGISWKGKVTPLDEITGISWGGVRQYINGFHTGTNYEIFICASYSKIHLRPDEKEYDEIISHLWNAVSGLISARILTQLQNLHDGETFSVGNIRLTDSGVFLTKSHWFSSDTKFFKWSEKLKAYGDNGFLVIEEGKYSAKSSYMNDMNTHILDAMLQNFLKRPSSSRQRLSSLLEMH